MNEKVREKAILKVSYLSIIVNCFLSVFKLIAGIVGNSVAMISDAVHSISDVLSTFVVILGVKLSSKVSDEGHQYGHERLESVMSIVLAIMLLLVGFEIGQIGLKNIFNFKNIEIVMPGMITIVAAILSILLKEGMYWVTYLIGKKYNSSMLKADAWHHRSDALSSIASLIGIVGFRLGFVLLDSIASLIICLVIIKIAIDIFKESFDKLVDKSCNKEETDKIKNIIVNIKGVRTIDDLKTRIFGDKIYVDIEIGVDSYLTVLEGHGIAQNVHDKLEEEIKEIKHCMVHINPV